MSNEFFDAALVWGLRVAYAAAVLIFGIWFAYYISRLARRHAELNPHIDTTLAAFLSRALRYVLVIVVLIVVLQMFGVQTASLVAIVGASALAIGLALQGTLTNVASGIVIALIRPFRIGDHVELNGKEGQVTDLDLFFTALTTGDNRRVLVPNGQAIASPIVNHTIQGRRSCEIAIDIDQDQDIDTALKVLTATMTGDPRALAQPDPWFAVKSLGESSVKLVGRVWTAKNSYGRYQADMLQQVRQAFDREGIALPRPPAEPAEQRRSTLAKI